MHWSTERILTAGMGVMISATVVMFAVPHTRKRAIHEAREMYRSLPGPHWVKLGIIGACLAIPGPQDELVLLGVLAVCRYVRSRRNR